jgi:hypothetical protein
VVPYFINLLMSASDQLCIRNEEERVDIFPSEDLFRTSIGTECAREIDTGGPDSKARLNLCNIPQSDCAIRKKASVMTTIQLASATLELAVVLELN